MTTLATSIYALDARADHEGTYVLARGGEVPATLIAVVASVTTTLSMESAASQPGVVAALHKWSREYLSVNLGDVIPCLTP